MEYIKAIDEINFNSEEVRNYIENNIEESEVLELFLKDIESDIKFKLENEQSKLRKEIDGLLRNDYIYIKNKDVFFNTQLNILMPNLETYKNGNIINNLKFGKYNGRLINKLESKSIYNNPLQRNLLKEYLTLDIEIFSNLKSDICNEMPVIMKDDGRYFSDKIFIFLENKLMPFELATDEDYLFYLEDIGRYDKWEYWEKVNFIRDMEAIIDNVGDLFDKRYICIDENKLYFNTELNSLILLSKENKKYINQFKFRKLNNKENKYFCNEILNTKDCDFLKENILYNIPVYDELKLSNTGIMFFLVNDLVPDKLTNKSEKIYLELLNLYNQGVILYNGKIDINSNLLKSLFLNGLQYINRDNESLDIKKFKDNLLSCGDIKIDLNFLKTKYLDCEKNRADIESYDEKILFDPNRGHWDLWDQKLDNQNQQFKLKTSILARNPVLDIKQDGIIGIDFGTKSTVVVFQENKENTMPMRIGIGNYSKEVNQEQYENPTVMQFINLEKFLKDYDKKIGRPNTKWEDLTISHTAQNNLINSSSDKYYSFLSDLKQWAGDSKRQIRIVDQNKFDTTLKSYIDLSEDDFDPIEIYAYYLGLYINNMRNGIYLDYLLSFPVTYEITTREKIIESFKKGIKKSLPETILENDEIMKDFSVEAGASEPAAYAICALTEYGFEPKEDENIFYGVFDFGGGTTDFDFGLFRQAKGREQRRFDYVIEHFGANGDKYLGGENLLELLAFEVFKSNEKLMRKENITFTIPAECEKFPGSEILISNSQEAKLNTKQLVEKLRPLWENTDKKDELSEELVKLNLFDKTGKQKPGMELLVDTEKLIQVLTDRIEVGILNFFDALKLSFKFNTEKVDNIKIFLAGNSSKSEIVKGLFERYIQDESQSISKFLNCDIKDFFEIYPPLGSIEACNLQEKMGIKVDENDLMRPTGKTGVAFGLLKGRKGGNIKVIDKNIVNNEINFKYYLGHNKRGKFRMEIDRDTEFNKWVEFIDAYEDRFEIYYTSQPKATNNDMDIKDVMRKKCKISITSEDEDVNVFIRFVSPSKIEYVVANRNEIGEEKYLSDIVVEELE